MAKLNRERAIREKREKKREKKEARAAERARIAAGLPPETEEVGPDGAVVEPAEESPV